MASRWPPTRLAVSTDAAGLAAKFEREPPAPVDFGQHAKRYPSHQLARIAARAREMENVMAYDTRQHSRIMVDGPGRAPARSYLKSIGLTSDDLKKPLVMVAHCWIGTMPCNLNQRILAQHVMAGVRAAGGTPMEVNTISISDGDHPWAPRA